MRIKCSHTDLGEPVVTRINNGPAFIAPLTTGWCFNDAVIIIVDAMSEYIGACEVHAPGAVHEAEGSMSADEFTVINLSAERRLENVRRYAVAMSDSISVANRGVATDVLDIINDEVTASIDSDGDLTVECAS